MPTPEHQRWSEDRVARELEAWFAQRCFDEWPPYSAFVADRRKRLRAALMRHGGPQRWARELGVAFIDRHRGPRRDEAEIRDRLRALYRQHRFTRFPSETLAARARPRALAEQIKQTGGARQWARELGVPGPQPAKWTDELIEVELALLCVGRTFWPTRAEFAQAGLSGLLTAVRRGLGSAWWHGASNCLSAGRSPTDMDARLSRHQHRMPATGAGIVSVKGAAGPAGARRAVRLICADPSRPQDRFSS